MQVRKSIAAALEIVGDLVVSRFVFGQPMTVFSVTLGIVIVGAVIVYSTASAGARRHDSDDGSDADNDDDDGGGGDEHDIVTRNK